MCVILVSGEERPTEEMVRAAWKKNPDGAGFAWRDGGEVVWEKGIKDVEDAVRLNASLPLPFVSHYRIETVGGKKPELTHPFPVDKEGTPDLKGRTPGMVLFHNGHWGDWNSKALDAAMLSNNKLPLGSWSDSRAMAWMVYIYGPGFMELLTSQKGVLMSPTTIKMFTGNDGWKKINKVWCSNEHFWDSRDRNWNNNNTNQNNGKRVYNYGNGRMCKFGKCQNQPEIAKDYCSAHPGGVDKASVADDSEDHTRVMVASPLAIITGGAQRREVAGLLETGILTLSKVEHMVANGTCSKNKAKDFRRAWDDAQQPGRQGERAQKAVARLSEKIIAAVPQKSRIH